MTGKCTYTASGVDKLKERRRHVRGSPAISGVRDERGRRGGKSNRLLCFGGDKKRKEFGDQEDDKTFMREVRGDLRNNDAVRK